jgi:hypothetical protein
MPHIRIVISYADVFSLRKESRLEIALDIRTNNHTSLDISGFKHFWFSIGYRVKALRTRASHVMCTIVIVGARVYEHLSALRGGQMRSEFA